MAKCLTFGIIVLLVASLGAEQVAPQEKPQFVLGRVVDAASGAGVPGARVTLGPVARPASRGEFVDIPSSLPVSGPRVITAADGRFLFRDVTPGRYSIGVDATGYVPALFGQARPGAPGMAVEVTSGSPRTDAGVRMWRYASLSGTVVDERGEPAVAVSVRCFVETFAGGQRRLRATLSILYTDDRGEYHVTGLEPGTYVCGVPARHTTRPISPAPASAADARRLQDSGSAAQSADGAGLRVGDYVLTSSTLARGSPPPAPDRTGRVLVYPTRFFPSAPTTSLASRITLAAGEHRAGVNLTLDLVPSTTISGIAQGPDGPVANLYLTLVPASGSEFVSEGTAIFADTITAAGGRFTFLGVPVGDYVLKSRLYPRPVAAASTSTQVEALDPASLELGLVAPQARTPARLPPPPPDDPGLWTAMPLSVGESPINDLVVALHPGVRVTGRLVFEGDRAQPTADQIQRMSIRLQSAEGRTSSPIPPDGRAAVDGTFRTAGLPAGRYIVSVLASSLPQGWRLRSADYLGKDVTVEPFEMADREVSGVVLTFTDKATQLAGTVLGIETTVGAEVIVFPADSTAWRTVGVAARRARNERVGKDGAFAISDLPPGEYFVAARPADASGDWRDPAVLDRLIRSATRVVLADGEQKRVDVKVVRP